MVNRMPATHKPGFHSHNPLVGHPMAPKVAFFDIRFPTAIWIREQTADEQSCRLPLQQFLCAGHRQGLLRICPGMLHQRAAARQHGFRESDTHRQPGSFPDVLRLPGRFSQTMRYGFRIYQAVDVFHCPAHVGNSRVGGSADHRAHRPPMALYRQAFENPVSILPLLPVELHQFHDS